MNRDTVRNFYEKGLEEHRLDQELFMLEGLRTKNIISRYLVETPLKIADVGGAAGYYAFWLQAMGHQVTLVDLSPKNIELAKECEARNGLKLNETFIGDATSLPLADGQFDLVLLLGPLYHLVTKEERLRTLFEAKGF